LSTLANEVVTAVPAVPAVTATAAIFEQRVVLPPEQVLLESAKPTTNTESIKDAVTLIKDETIITNIQETTVKEKNNDLSLSQIEIIPIQEISSIQSISVPSDLFIMKPPSVSEVIIDTNPVVITKPLLPEIESKIESTKVVTSSESRLNNLSMEDATEVILYTIRAHQEHQNSPSR
jgi:hypothetical protein